MQKTFILSSFMLCGVLANANPVDLKNNGIGNHKRQVITNLPFDVDFDFDKLRIRLKDSNSLAIVVVGPQGVVYNKVITAATSKSVYVDLEKYRDGDYNIYIQDAKGNNVSGEFYKENISLNY